MKRVLISLFVLSIILIGISTVAASDADDFNVVSDRPNLDTVVVGDQNPQLGNDDDPLQGPDIFEPQVGDQDSQLGNDDDPLQGPDIFEPQVIDPNPQFLGNDDDPLQCPDFVIPPFVNYKPPLFGPNSLMPTRLSFNVHEGSDFFLHVM